MGAQKECNPDQYEILVNVIPMSGFSEDSIVGIEEDGPRYFKKKGVDGTISRSKNLALCAIVTLSLMQTSESNAVLSSLAQLGAEQDDASDVFPLLIRDGNGTSVFATDTAWIEEMPKVQRGQQAGVNEWKICCVDYTFFEGGT